jgi:hypothetical protein
VAAAARVLATPVSSSDARPRRGRWWRGTAAAASCPAVEAEVDGEAARRRERDTYQQEPEAAAPPELSGPPDLRLGKHAEKEMNF